MVTPVLIAGIGWKTYLIFMILLGLFVPIVYYCYPETSNLSLEEVDNLFLPASDQVRAGSISYIKDDSTDSGLAEKGHVSHRFEKV